VPPVNAGGIRDAGLIPGSGRPPGEGNETQLNRELVIWKTELMRFLRM